LLRLIESLRPFISVRLDEDSLDDLIRDLKEKVEKIASSSDKNAVVIFKGILRKSGVKDILKILEDYGLKAGSDQILHFNFNITREIQLQDESFILENEEKLISEELKKIIGDKDLYSSVKEVIDHLRSFESIDDAKKYLKENPDLLEL